MKFYIVYLNLLDDDQKDFPGIHRDTTLPIIHHNSMRFILYAITDDKSLITDFMKIRNPDRFFVSEKNESKKDYMDLYYLYQDLNIGIRSVNIRTNDDSEYPYKLNSIQIPLTYNEWNAIQQGRKYILNIVSKIPDYFIHIIREKYYDAFKTLMYSDLVTDMEFDDLPFNYVELDGLNMVLLLFHNILNKDLLELYTQLGLDYIAEISSD